MKYILIYFFQWYENELYKDADPRKSFLKILRDAKFPDTILQELEDKVKNNTEGPDQQQQQQPKVM